jgi:hypothetical protein
MSPKPTLERFAITRTNLVECSLGCLFATVPHIIPGPERTGKRTPSRLGSSGRSSRSYFQRTVRSIPRGTRALEVRVRRPGRVVACPVRRSALEGGERAGEVGKDSRGGEEEPFPTKVVGYFGC